MSNNERPEINARHMLEAVYFRTIDIYLMEISKKTVQTKENIQIVGANIQACVDALYYLKLIEGPNLSDAKITSLGETVLGR